MNSISNNLPTELRVWDPGKAGKVSDERLRYVAKRLEGVFASFMLKELGESFSASSTSAGSNVYSDFYTQILTDNLTEGDGLGLQQIIYGQIRKSNTEAGSPKGDLRPKEGVQ